MKKMNYDSILELHNITVEECETLYNKKNLCSVIHDGEIVDFEKEGK